MRDIPVPKVLLNRSRVVTVIGEFVSGGVAQHVRVDREREFGVLAGARHELAHCRRRHRTAQLADKQIRRGGIPALELAQRADLGAADRVCRRQSVLHARDVQEPGFQIHLVPAQRDELRDPEAVAVGDEKEGAIARAVAAELAGPLQNLLDFVGGEILASAPRRVGEPGRGILGPGVPRARRSTGFLLRRRERTFPFTSIGADFAAAYFLETCAMAGSITLPFTVFYGNVTRYAGRTS